MTKTNLLVIVTSLIIVFMSCNNHVKKETNRSNSDVGFIVYNIHLAEGATMHPEYVKTIARTAYVWGWTMVNSHNRRANITQAPEPGRLGGVRTCCSSQSSMHAI